LPDNFRVNQKTQQSQIKAENQWLASEANWRDLAQIKIPVWATAGKQDKVTPAINMKRISDQVQLGQYHLFAGSHAFLFSARKVFSSRLQKFLSEK